MMEGMFPIHVVNASFTTLMSIIFLPVVYSPAFLWFPLTIGMVGLNIYSCMTLYILIRKYKRLNYDNR